MIRTHVENNSMFNTPPVFLIYAWKETQQVPDDGRPQPALPRYGREGGPFADEHLLRDGRGAARAGSRVYGVRQELRMVGIKATVWWAARASCHNALPKESVEALVACMQEFAEAHKK